MAGPGPAIHVFGIATPQDVDARDKRGHDEEFVAAQRTTTNTFIHTITQLSKILHRSRMIMRLSPIPEIAAGREISA
jgi:hypothetical protein